MFQERSPGQGPNFLQPRGPFSQQQRPNFQRMPQGNRSFLQQRPQQPQTGRQFRGNGPFQQQPNNKGGLLGKLFSKSKQTPPNLFAPPSGAKKETRSGGILDTLKNPEGLNTMLNNTQRVLQAAEQFTPMIQQYGPIVKNLPSIWKIMRAFNSSDKSSDTNKEETETKSNTTTKNKSETKTKAKKQEVTESSSSESTIEKKTNGRVQKKKSESVPKLYI